MTTHSAELIRLVALREIRDRARAKSFWVASVILLVAVAAAVIIPALTPGICESTDNDKLMISFEKGNNDLAFGPGSGYTYNDYVLYGTEWKNGTASVTYDSNKFRASCGSCTDVASATLVIRKSELDKMERKIRTLKGRTVGDSK